jgi:hypothetical protein
MQAKKLNIRCYDNGGKTFDRYTVVYLDLPEENGLYESVGMSAHPFHPQGFGQHGAARLGKHLGKLIAFTKMPEDCQKVVLQDLTSEA